MGAYEDMLARRAVDARLSMSGGSGYFAPRGSSLDPSLFEHGDHLRPEVRRLVQHLLYSFWQRKYAHPQVWSKLWIAGSGITTAWNATREADGAPGDLDVLLGIDYEAMRQHNPAFRGSSDAAIARFLNQELHDGLWKHTENTRIGSGHYEVTYYVNGGVGTDRDALRAINPYAAYNVSDDEWTVHPVEVPADFGEHYFSDADRATAHGDLTVAVTLMAKYNALQERLRTASAPERVNLLLELREVVRAGADAFTSIHSGRKEAFAPGGKGYFDPANYRWQAGKGSGAITVLRQLKQLDEAAQRDIAHNRPTDPQYLTLLAALANGGGRG